MEMSKEISFWYEILLKMFVCFVCLFLFLFWKNGKKSFFFFRQAKNNKFELQMLKLLENHVKTLL